MNVRITPRGAVFGAAGRYVLEDPFKPHLAELLTPAGHNLTLVSPADHRHHKGVMFALRCADLNFWEEEPGSGGCGVQVQTGLKLIDGGIVQELLWRREDGALETYQETRTLTCRRLDAGCGFAWTWCSSRRALRPHRLIKSPWSAPLPSGRTVNYHGLGVRLPWAWAYPHETVAGAQADGIAADPAGLMGSRRGAVTIWGKIDGHWNAPACAVTVAQDRQYPWYVLRDRFAYLAVGPSNLEEVGVAEGELFTECYRITAEDLPAPAG